MTSDATHVQAAFDLRVRPAISRHGSAAQAPNQHKEQRGRVPGARPRLSVIIPVYQGEDTLADCLQGLDAQTVATGDVEVIVVDNNSSDGSADIARSHPRVCLLQEPEQGAYAARNKALQCARGEIFVFTDPDCIADPHWLATIIETFADPSTAVAIGASDPAGSTGAISLLGRYEREKDRYALGSADPLVYYGHTNNMAVHRRVFEAVGIFDRCRRGGDTMLVRRVADRFGCDSIRYVPTMRVRHMEIATAGDYFHKVRTYARSSVAYGAASGARPLTTAERWRVYRKLCARDDVTAWGAFHVAILLGLGMLNWHVARAAAQAGTLSARGNRRQPIYAAVLAMTRLHGRVLRRDEISSRQTRVGRSLDAVERRLRSRRRAQRRPSQSRLFPREDRDSRQEWVCRDERWSRVIHRWDHRRRLQQGLPLDVQDEPLRPVHGLEVDSEGNNIRVDVPAEGRERWVYMHLDAATHPWNNYRWRFTACRNSPFREFQFAFRYVDFYNRYRIRHEAGRLRFDIVRKGRFHLDITTLPFEMQIGREYRFEVEVRDRRFLISVDDRLVFDEVDPFDLFPRGPVAIILWEDDEQTDIRATVRDIEVVEI